MKPSTLLKIGIGLGIPALLLAMHFLLPRTAVWFGGAQTGLKPHETAHFTAYASDPKNAERAAHIAESFIGDLVGRWGKSRGFALPDARVEIFLFDDHDSLNRHGLLKLGQSLENNGGYFSTQEHAIALVKGGTGALRHELTHMTVGLSWGNADVSPWFSEGYAQWHESGAEGSMPAQAVREARVHLGEPGFLPLSALLVAEQADFASADNDKFYYEAVTLVGWLAKTRPDAFERVIALERAIGRPTAEEFAFAVGLPLPQIEAEWKAFIADAGK